MTSLKKIRRVYLDHAAATPLDPRVARAMAPYWGKMFGNPNALHREGVLARKAVDQARKTIALLLGVHADEIIFTGSATESANLAIAGTIARWKEAHPDRVPHMITSAVEHDAVLAPTRKLRTLGVRVTEVPVSHEGIVDVRALRESITEDTVLVSIMYAQNEIGTIEPIREIAHEIRKWKKTHRNVSRSGKPVGDELYPLFHTDATQAVNYCDTFIPRLGVQLLTMNAAKIYGPKGIGLLVVRRGTPVAPILLGGGHERGFRAGTEHVPAIVGFALALQITLSIAEKESKRLLAIRDHFVKELTKIPSLVVNGTIRERLPNNINFSITGVDHEFLALALDAKGFAVATKSACNEGDAETSRVLAAIAPDDSTHPRNGIRLSLGRATTKSDVKAFMKVIHSILKTMIVG